MASTIKAHAKVNLHLEVLNRRDDGYHNIFSLMASVALHDLLKLEDVEIKSSGEHVDVILRAEGGSHREVIDAIPAQRNIITQAARQYFSKAGMTGRAVFSIEKNIPAGAGLGGGSSDAAATLILLNGHFSLFTLEELMQMGRDIGADVPFCLTGGFAVCRGIGDHVRTVPGTLGYQVLIINNGFHIDSGKAYATLNRSPHQPDSMEENIRRRTDRIVAALAGGSIGPVSPMLANDFEAPVFRQYPEIGEIKEKLYRCGADFALMTGSGSSVVALFSGRESAEAARAMLSGNYRDVILTEFIEHECAR